VKTYSRGKTESFTLDYSYFGSEKKRYLYLSSWPNGDGYAISWHGEDGAQQIVDLSHEDISAMIAAFNLLQLPGGE